MPRYVVERTFTDGFGITTNERGVEMRAAVISTNRQCEVTWIHSYVTPDRSKTYCIYDAPSPEAGRQSARRNEVPIDKIIEIRVLGPYFYSP
jgi:hypothetical protein